MKPKLHLLLHSADLVEERLRIELSLIGVRPRQARIIDALDRMGTASQVELAREFNVTPASMSTMTSRLIKAGYITRETDPEELRSSILSLSDSGRALLEDIRAVWRIVDRKIERALGKKRAEQLAALTLDLRDGLGGRAPGSDKPERTIGNPGARPGDQVE
ncbi:MarR family transcriptional regulator [Rhodobacteraceae bacterium NNCM2]|nr:MarR family transcriptional regulator [Coraliihabitans acroporae]